jgi:hypothetical protein
VKYTFSRGYAKNARNGPETRTDAREDRSMIQTAAKPPKRKIGSASARKEGGRDKCTLLLDPDTSLKLTIAAHLRGLDRSDLVNELLADALRGVVVSIRGSVASIDRLNPADGVSQGSVTAA